MKLNIPKQKVLETVEIKITDFRFSAGRNDVTVMYVELDAEGKQINQEHDRISGETFVAVDARATEIVKTENISTFLGLRKAIYEYIATKEGLTDITIEEIQ